MRGRRRDVRERGSVTPLVWGVSLVFVAFALGGATIGRQAAVRQDAQRAADAAVLAASYVIKEQGLPFTPAKRTIAESIARKNSGLPATFVWTLSETGTYVDFTVTASLTMGGALKWMYPSGTTTVNARAKGRATQSKFDEATRRLPKFVLVLDYSGSMNQIMDGGGGKKAIDVLEDNVRTLLDLGLDIEYGAVLFETDIRTSVGIGPGAPGLIKARMAANGADGWTCTSCGLNRANNLLSAVEDTGRYVLLVSDGDPNEGGGKAGARTAAAGLWGIGATIFTLHIDWTGGTNTGLRDFLISVSGTPGGHPDAGYYYRATDAGTLASTFSSIVSSIVCSVGPMAPAPSDPASMRVFLRTPAGIERAIPAVADLAAAAGIEAYRWDGPTATVRLTETACDAVMDASNEVVVRFGSPTLIE